MTAATGSAPSAVAGPVTVDLQIGGMTCASCAARVEKKLNRLDGVSASVNYATEKALVTLSDPAVGVDDLVATVARTGYTARPIPKKRLLGESNEARDEAAQVALRRRVLVSAALTLGVVTLTMVPGVDVPGGDVVALLLATPVVAWGAWPLHRAAALNLRHGAATMDTLVSMGTLAAYGWSVYALTLGEPGYLEVAGAVTTFVLAGRYAEARARRRAGAALRALLELGAADVAVVASDGSEQRRPVDTLRVGDRFVVRPGEKVATDGVVEDGRSALDLSLLTGESVPVDVGPGDVVVGATINSGGRLVVRASRVGADTRLAQLARLVEQAQSGKAEVQRLADRISAIFVPVVLVIALLTLVGWLMAGGGAERAVTAAVAVLVIACPCALGLATPTALLVGTGRGAQLGIVIKGPEVLERTRRIDTVVLDKTGTVTSGRMSVTEVVARAGVDRDDVLRLAAAVEHGSEHPIAAAVVAAADDHLSASDFVATGGLGAEAIVEGSRVLVGRERFLRERGIVDLGPELQAALTRVQSGGATVIAVGRYGHAVASGAGAAADGGRVVGLIAVADTVKDTSADAVRGLRALGLTPMLLTGDNAVVAAAVAREVGIDPAQVVADVMPHDKVEVVRRLQAQGHVVAMVGDGVNDAAALAASDLGIAMGTGSDVAIEAGDLTIVNGDLRAAARAIRLSRRTLGTIRTNLFWAFAYNVAALPLAASGLLSPMIAGAAMAASSVLVVGNSLRLRRFE